MVADDLVELGPYRLEGLLGRGGVGEVHRALDRRHGRVVALKILPPELAYDQDFRVRFSRECESAAQLQDPHIVPVHGFGEIDERLYIDMPLVEGVGLDRFIASGPMAARRAVALIAQIAEALSDAHARGMPHCDVKPSNILVTPSDFACLVDFGVARALDEHRIAAIRSGAPIGTLAYMAPERFDGGPPDHRADIYSLACTLAECLTGHPPFDATNLQSIVQAHLTADPPRPSLHRGDDVPRALDTVIARGMAKDLGARYPAARDLAADAQRALQRLASPSAGRISAPAPRKRAVAATRNRRRLFGLAAVPVVLAAAWIGTSFVLDGSSAAPGAEVTSGPPTPFSTAPLAQEAPAPAAPTTTIDAPAAPTPDERSPSYTYTVESNYPVSLIYTDSNGQQASEPSITTPWSVNVDTASWGAGAAPRLIANSTSTAGDTIVTCTITDDTGQVIMTQTRETAFAAAVCTQD